MMSWCLFVSILALAQGTRPEKTSGSSFVSKSRGAVAAKRQGGAGQELWLKLLNGGEVGTQEWWGAFADGDTDGDRQVSGTEWLALYPADAIKAANAQHAQEHGHEAMTEADHLVAEADAVRYWKLIALLTPENAAKEETMNISPGEWGLAFDYMDQAGDGNLQVSLQELWNYWGGPPAHGHSHIHAQSFGGFGAGGRVKVWDDDDKFIETIDANGDDSVEIDEWWQFFNEMDRDGNRELDSSEWQEAGFGDSHGRKYGRLFALLARLTPEEGDLEISAEEWTLGFEYIDIDNSLGIDKTEVGKLFGFTPDHVHQE